MKYSNLSQKNPKGSYSQKKQGKKQSNGTNQKQIKKIVKNEKKIFDNNDQLILLLNSSSSSINKKIELNKSKSKQKSKNGIKLKKKNKIIDKHAKSMDSIQLSGDMSSMNSKDINNKNILDEQKQKKEKRQVLILEDVSIQQQQQSLDLLDSDLLSNQEINYSLLQIQYQKLIKKQDKNIQQKYDDSQILSKVLNLSLTQFQKQKKSQQLIKKNKKEILLQQKFQQLLKILGKFVSLKENKVQNNSSINLSRTSEYKKILNNNLFQINQEWQHSQIMNKQQKKNDKQNTNLQEFTLNQINKNYLQENSLKKDKGFQQGFEIKKKRFFQKQSKKNIAANKIKCFWKAYSNSKKHKNINKFQQYQHFIFEPDKIQQQKVQQYFNRQQINQIETRKPQDNINTLLNQLQNQSNRQMGNDHSQYQQLQYKQYNVNIINTILKKQANSNSFLQQQRKKIHGDSIVLQHLQSISAIRSNSKFRQLSDHDYQSQIKQQDTSTLQNIYDIINRRQAWIEQKVKYTGNKIWRYKQIDLINKIKQIIKDPTSICFDIENNDKCTSTEQQATKDQLIKKKSQNYNYSKKSPKKYRSNNKPFQQYLSNQKMSEQQFLEILSLDLKDYLNEKGLNKFNNINISRLIKKQSLLKQYQTLIHGNIGNYQHQSEQYFGNYQQNKNKILSQFQIEQPNKNNTSIDIRSITQKVFQQIVVEIIKQKIPQES